MSEEKKGRVKVTVEVEINEPLMGVMKETITKMSSMLPDIMRHRREEKQ